MASLFGHALVASTAGTLFESRKKVRGFLMAGVVCSILPDADVLAFSFGIPYHHPLGHRGFTHSLTFSLMLGFWAANLFSDLQKLSRDWWLTAGYLSMCTFSHAVLDALTNGGLGVAFFWPLDNTRYFLPWQPIQVSPIGIANFFSHWGFRVLVSELVWVGLPCAALYVLSKTLKRR